MELARSRMTLPPLLTRGPDFPPPFTSISIRCDFDSSPHHPGHVQSETGEI